MNDKENESEYFLHPGRKEQFVKSEGHRRGEGRCKEERRKTWQRKRRPANVHQLVVEGRVAKCHGYGGYIRVKKLEGWGKKSGRIHSFAKSRIVLGKFEQLI